MSDQKIRANLYIDGNFTVHIHKFLTKKYGKTIDWKAFLEYIKEQISQKEKKVCILESNFFVGTSVKTSDEERDFLFTSMDHESIQRHATPLKEKDSGGLKEDAVDTNLVFTATQDFYKYKPEQYDYLVLLAGDSDFVPLVKGLAKEAVKTFLIYMNFEDKELGKTQVAQSLLEEADISVNLADLISDGSLRKSKGIFTEHKSAESKKEPESEPAKKGFFLLRKKPASEKTVAEKKEIVIVKKKVEAVNKTGVDSGKKPAIKKKDISVNKKNVPFSEKQLEAAIIKTQKKKNLSQNDFVLIAQVGETLSEIIGTTLHGKLVNIINRNFADAFDFDFSNKSAPKIRQKNRY